MSLSFSVIDDLIGNLDSFCSGISSCGFDDFGSGFLSNLGELDSSSLCKDKISSNMFFERCIFISNEFLPAARSAAALALTMTKSAAALAFTAAKSAAPLASIAAAAAFAFFARSVIQLSSVSEMTES